MFTDYYSDLSASGKAQYDRYKIYYDELYERLGNPTALISQIEEDAKIGAERIIR